MTEQPIPERADHDTDEAWGDPPDDDADTDHLESERPPHYDER